MQTAIKSFKQAENAPECITIFTGDAFGGNGKILEVTSKLIVDALPMMGLDAMAVGEYDLSVEREQLLAMLASSQVPFICANLELKGIKPYTLVSRSGKKILITAALDPQLLSSVHETTIKLSDPVESIKKVLATVEHDISIVVLHFDQSNVSDATKSLASASLILSGHAARTDCSQEVVNPATNEKVISAANNTGGRNMAYVDIDFSGQAPNILNHELLYLDDQVQADEVMFALVDVRERQYTTATKAEAEFGRFKFISIKSYAGVEWCTPCHGDIVESWRETDHAKAISTLEKEKMDTNTQCIGCHVTGFMSAEGFNGFIRRDVTPEFENVQCEACHGPASEHLLDPKNALVANVPESVCRSCHTPERDPDFDFKNDVMRGSHVIP